MVGHEMALTECNQYVLSELFFAKGPMGWQIAGVSCLAFYKTIVFKKNKTGGVQNNEEEKKALHCFGNFPNNISIMQEKHHKNNIQFH